jgi:hypothetical protein
MAGAIDPNGPGLPGLEISQTPVIVDGRNLYDPTNLPIGERQ